MNRFLGIILNCIVIVGCHEKIPEATKSSLIDACQIHIELSFPARDDSCILAWDDAQQEVHSVHPFIDESTYRTKFAWSTYKYSGDGTNHRVVERVNNVDLDSAINVLKARETFTIWDFNQRQRYRESFSLKKNWPCDTGTFVPMKQVELASQSNTRSFVIIARPSGSNPSTSLLFLNFVQIHKNGTCDYCEITSADAMEASLIYYQSKERHEEILFAIFHHHIGDFGKNVVLVLKRTLDQSG
jgi:hypothetical protein